MPSGEVVVSKSFGPWTNGANFNMAVDEESGIGILTTRGASMYEVNPKFRMCSGSSVHAINLLTGQTLWQLVNPYSNGINTTSCWFSGGSPRSFPLDRSINESCSFGEWYDNGLDDNLGDIEPIIPPLFNHYNITQDDGSQFPISASSRTGFSSPVTIIKNMVFIPGSSGDIWVHNLFNGEFIKNFQCPPVLRESDGRWNRYGFKGGVSVIDKYIVYYCGDYGGGSTRNGNILVALKLDDE